MCERNISIPIKKNGGEAVANINKLDKTML